MKYQPLISVIIPAYNTAKYISRMLDCVINQTYQNLEIIIINDGSTDETLSIAKHYSSIDNRFIIIDIPNGGVSNARNEGIRKCSGEKIFFWDSDDIIEYTTIEKCLSFSIENNVNTVIYNYSSLYGKPHKSILNKGGVYTGYQIVNDIVPCFIGHSFGDVNKWIKGYGMRYGKENTALWHIMCDTEIIKNNHLLFDKNLSLGEDTIFINSYLLHESSIGYLDECLYYLDQREDGANLSSMKNLSKRLSDKIKLIYARLEIDKYSIKLNGIDTHKYWEGTLVFSGIELAIRLSKEKKMSLKQRLQLFQNFMDISTVKQAYKDFKPVMGLRALPFLWIKLLGSISFFHLCRIIPNSLISKLT